MSEPYFQMLQRHMATRRKMISAASWRRKQLELGLTMTEILDDPETRDLVEELEAYPEETNEIRDAKRAEDQARIRRENYEQRQRLAYMRPTIDDDTEDDEVGVARAAARAESAQRRREERVAISLANKAHRMRLAAVKARTDDDVSDDPSGMARRQVAAASRARKQAEAQRIQAENRAFRHRMANVHGRDDHGEGRQ